VKLPNVMKPLGNVTTLPTVLLQQTKLIVTSTPVLLEYVYQLRNLSLLILTVTLVFVLTITFNTYQNKIVHFKTQLVRHIHVAKLMVCVLVHLLLILYQPIQNVENVLFQEDGDTKPLVQLVLTNVNLQDVTLLSDAQLQQLFVIILKIYVIFQFVLILLACVTMDSLEGILMLTQITFFVYLEIVK